jgi:hypothetical protein
MLKAKAKEKEEIWFNVVISYKERQENINSNTNVFVRY